MVYVFTKRIFDIVFSFSVLVLASIPLAVTMLLIRMETKGNAIYWSERVGIDGSTYMMPKFRTMFVGTPELPTGELSNPGQYITGIGRRLRKSSLDELPQFYSVLVGHMSVVGPRPMIPQEQEIFRERVSTGVAALRPGITGWAQINGRDALSVEEKVALDVQYLQRRSFWFDLKIVFLTVGYVFKGKDISH